MGWEAKYRLTFPTLFDAYGAIQPLPAWKIFYGVRMLLPVIA